MVEATEKRKVQEGCDFVKPRNRLWLLLWDIDGTLMSSDGAGRSSMEHVFKQMYGIPHALEEIELAGRTDAAILLDLFRHHGIDPHPDVLEKFRNGYFRRLDRIIALNHAPTALPGIHTTLTHLDNNSGVVSGLLTGNWKTSAFIKLGSVGLDHRFRIGAFAEDAPTRPELLPVALDRFRADGHGDLSYGNTVIIGDTPYDIAVAKAYGARSVAVATGIHDAKLLMEAEPDLLLHTFDPERFMKVLALWNSGS